MSSGAAARILSAGALARPAAQPLSDRALEFDTDDLDPRDRAGAYRALYAPGADVEILSAAGFRAVLRVRRRAGLLLHRRTLSQVVHGRDVRRVRRDGFDHFVLHLNLRGSLQVEAEDQRRTVAPGEAVFLDMTRPTRHLAEGEIATLSLPRALVADPRQHATSLHGAVVPTWRAARLAQWLAAFWTAPGAGAEPDLDALLEALDVAVRDAPSPARPGRGDREAIQRDRIRGIIERGLGDPDQTPERMAAEACLSRATLYRMFERLGTPSSWRQARRLWRFRQALAAGQGPIADAAEAAGISDPSYATALFSRAVGMTPSRYRNELEQMQTAPNPEGALRWVMANVPILLGADAR